jgi:hypothetical protein
MASIDNDLNVGSGDKTSLQDLPGLQPFDVSNAWDDEMIVGLVDSVENWIRSKMEWDQRDHYDRRQMALDTVAEAIAYRQEHQLTGS